MNKTTLNPVCLFMKIRGAFPRRLPIGVTEFNRFCDFTFETYGIPNLPSYRQLMAQLIQHMQPKKPWLAPRNYVSPRYFAKHIRKAQANEVAHHMFFEIKEQNEKIKEATLKAVTGEATPIQGTPSIEAVSK